MASKIDVLKRYLDGGSKSAAGEEKKKKKKKKAVVPGGISIIDYEVTDWHGKRAGFSDDEPADGDEAPVVDSVVEIRSSKAVVGLREDGSGWLPVDSGDASPPRRGRQDSPDASPPRRGRHDSPDASPPRRGRHDSPDASPPRRVRHDSPDDSPPRRGRQNAPDASPPRRGRHDSPDASPPRRGRNDSPDASPPRRGAPAGDSSPPHRGAAAGDSSPPRRREDDQGAGRKPKMTDGSKAGLLTGQEVMEDARVRAENERKRMQGLTEEESGRGAATVYRNRATGGVVQAEEFIESRKKKKTEHVRPEWGGGLAQKREAEAQRAAVEDQKNKPFARYANDAELDADRKRVTRWGDPLAGAVREAPEAPLPLPGGDADLLQRGGFKIPTQIPPHSWIKRKIGAPINRYQLKPGRHWDGVDRSNGFEAQMFKMKNDISTRDRDMRQWVTSMYE